MFISTAKMNNPCSTIKDTLQTFGEQKEDRAPDKEVDLFTSRLAKGWTLGQELSVHVLDRATTMKYFHNSL